jgi:hypothetical protein
MIMEKYDYKKYISKGIFMKDKLSIAFSFLILLCLFISCSKKMDIIHIQQNIENINEIKSDPLINETYSEKYVAIKKTNITDFYFDEIMKSFVNLDFHRDKYKVIEYFGEPLEINIIPTLFNFAGGVVIEIHKYVYVDLIHYYYVFENGTIFYNGFMIEKKLERLKTINIGDTRNKLLSTFLDKYYSNDKNENISYYTDPVICDIQFIIENNTIQKIFVNYILI